MRISHLIILAIAGSLLTSTGFAAGQLEGNRLSGMKWGPCDPKLAPADTCKIAYFRGNPEKEENYSMIKVPKGYKFPAHWHTAEEHIVVTKGTFVIGAEGQQKDLTFKPGDYVYVPANVVHWASFPEDTTFYLNVVGPDSYIDVKDRRP